MPALAQLSNMEGSKSSLAPATNAMSHLPMCKAEMAASKATREEEQAVS